MAAKGTVCVTGAGGYVASWVVKLLLSNNYTVHGTVRDPQDDKYNHLKKLEQAPDSLKLFKADLLDYNSMQPSEDAMEYSMLQVQFPQALYQTLR